MRCFADTLEKVIDGFDFSAAPGWIANRRRIVELASQEVDELPVPGGRDLSTLCITSAVRDLTAENLAGQPRFAG